MRIFICGFSGAGKTTFGEKLSKDNIFQVYDLDEEIFNRMGSGYDHLGEYIEEVGIETFREDEIDMIKLLHQNLKDNYVISLGGGALESQSIVEHIQGIQGKLVFLDTSFEECWNRLLKHNDRPLKKKGKAFMESLYNQRLPLFKQADLVLSNDSVNEIETISDLIKRLN